MRANEDLQLNILHSEECKNISQIAWVILGLLRMIMKIAYPSGVEDCFPAMVLTITNLTNKIRDIG